MRQKSTRGRRALIFSTVAAGVWLLQTTTTSSGEGTTNSGEGRHALQIAGAWLLQTYTTNGGEGSRAPHLAWLGRAGGKESQPPDESDTPEIEQPWFLTKVVGAAAQGAVAACVAAWLSAFTEPVLNRVLVERCTLWHAMQVVKVKDCLAFFLTTFSSNMLKFPVFEVINMILSFTSLSGPMRGTLSGWLFCTVMLPVTNYRFRRSMNLPIKPSLLYQAYPPTVLRDMSYGWARGLIFRTVVKGCPACASFHVGRAFLFGLTISISCIVSSPFNEWRGYWLQQPSKKLPFKQFFKPERYLRSTGIGALIMGMSLMIGMLSVPLAEDLFGTMGSHKLISAVVIVGVIAIQRFPAQKQDRVVRRHLNAP